MHLEIMLIWQFVSIYIADAIASYVYSIKSSSILFAIVYIGSFALLNGLSTTQLFQSETLNLQMIIVPIIALALQNTTYTFNKNFWSSLIVESFAAAVVEEMLFRTLIPANFDNLMTGEIVSGILFAIIHIKSFDISLDTTLRIFTTSILFDILMFQQKPNNVLYHFMWNFITLTIVKSADLSGTSITPIEISNNTIILFTIVILLNWINIANTTHH
mgnify:CR=1 FL=1